jgi:hypothetical protein
VRSDAELIDIAQISYFAFGYVDPFPRPARVWMYITGSGIKSIYIPIMSLPRTAFPESIYPSALSSYRAVIVPYPSSFPLSEKIPNRTL